MLHLNLIVKEVKEDINDHEHILVYAIIEAPPQSTNEPSLNSRIIQIGAPPEKNPMREIGQHIHQSLQDAGFMPQQIRKPVAGISLYITQHMFIQLGRPTTGDTVSLDGRTLRRRI